MAITIYLAIHATVIAYSNSSKEYEQRAGKRSVHELLSIASHREMVYFSPLSGATIKFVTSKFTSPPLIPCLNPIRTV